MEQNNELAHYGILGMKWGVRKQKYYEKKAKSSSGEKAKKYMKKAKEQARANKKYKKAYKAKILSNPTKLYLNRNKFTDAEIKKAMDKYNTEQRLRSYSKESFSYGNEMAKRARGYVITAAATYAFIKKGAPLVEKLLDRTGG